MKIIRNFVVLLVVFLRFKSSFAEDMSKNKGEDCYRDCRGSESRICYFHFTLEHYHAMGPICGTCGEKDGNVNDCFNKECVLGDGTIRGAMTINRQIPGPTINVCNGDLIVVDVTNKMAGTATTIHWHGFHQRKTPFYDGVPFVTQCPINFANTFRYAFKASGAGTQFYHSHSGHHKMNGIYGGIAVRKDPDQDPHGFLYNNDLKEHMIIVSDWMENYAEMFMPGLPKHKTGNEPTNILINGKAAKWDELTRKSKTATPIEVFHVEEGQRYRFRFVNSMALACPAELEIENHSMLVIASDSYDLQPVSVDQLVSTSGERYDFVLNANQSHHGDTFWIRIRALGPCAVTRRVQQFAVLTYLPKSMDEDHQLAFPTQPIPEYSHHFVSGDAQFESLNHPNTTCGEPKKSGDICLCDLHSLSYRTDITHGEPDFRFVLGFKNWAQKPKDIFGGERYEHFMYSSASNRLLVSAINNISLNFPPMTLLTQSDEYDDSLFCDQHNRPEHCNRQICHCVHRLKIPLNSLVELVVADENEHINELNHPFHLHGANLYVMEQGQKRDKTPITVEEVEELTSMSQMKKFEYSPKFLHPMKDTISIPSNGFTRFRFKADNPGFWLLHCHFEWHLAVGMGLVLQVGEVDEMAKPPHGFPKCNNFEPSVDEILQRRNE